MPMSDKEACQQLEELMKDMRQWVNDNLKAKSPERAKVVNTNLKYLGIEIRQNPEQARAVLYCANAMWHMLFEDAWAGGGMKHRRKPLPPKDTKDAATIDALLDKLHKKHPRSNITGLRSKACGILEIGRSTLLEKTKYDPCKK